VTAPSAQRFPRDERHHIKEQAIRVARVEQRQNVRVLELGGGPDLGQEPLATDGGREVGVQYLDRDLSVVPHIMGEVDRRHAAGAQLALNAIPALDGRSESGLKAACDLGLDHEQSKCCSMVTRSMSKERLKIPTASGHS